MGFFKKLVDILFGTQKEYAVKDLGIFHSKVCDWWQNEHYSWWSTIQLPLYSTETVIWIEGDAQAPLSQHILDLQVLLKNWESVMAKVENLLPTESRLAHKEEIYTSWQNRFYPEAIESSVKYNNSWKITFTTDDLDYSFSIIWKNNTVRDLTLY